MTGLERVRRAIYFQGPDRIPHALPDGGPNDIVRMPSPDIETGVATEWQETEPGVWQRSDEWGSAWRRFGPSGSGEVIQPALADWERLEEVLTLLATMPPVEPLRAFEQSMTPGQRAGYCLVTVPYPSIFAGSHALRGLSNLLTDFYVHPEQVCRLLDRFVESQVMCVDLVAEFGAHGVIGYDDWGIQDRPLISPSLWQEFFEPRYRLVWQHAHARGIDVWLHSCGYILPLLPMMIQCGLNVVQMDQQENMGLQNLGQAVGGQVAFWCPVDIQQTMVKGSEEDIDHYVRKMMYHLGRYRGGLISKVYDSPQDVGHTPQKIAAMCRSFRRWGVYPLPDEVLAVANEE